MHGRMNRSLVIVISLFVTVFVYLFTTQLLVFDEDYYDTWFSRHGVYSERNDANDIVANLLGFFRNDEGINEEFYETNEVSHLYDVKDLILNGSALLLLSFFIVLIGFGYGLYTQDFGSLRIAILSSGLAIVAVALLFYVGSLHFDRFFMNFHLTFFPQGNFLFSENSTLITLFPQQFFVDILAKILLRSVISGIFLTVVGLLLFVPNWKKIHYNKV